jgi:hypothetical protein
MKLGEVASSTVLGVSEDAQLSPTPSSALADSVISPP